MILTGVGYNVSNFETVNLYCPHTSYYTKSRRMEVVHRSPTSDMRVKTLVVSDQLSTVFVSNGDISTTINTGVRIYSRIPSSCLAPVEEFTNINNVNVNVLVMLHAQHAIYNPFFRPIWNVLVVVYKNHPEA